MRNHHLPHPRKAIDTKLLKNVDHVIFHTIA